MIILDKKFLREKSLAKKRADLSPKNIIEYSDIIAEKLYKMDSYKEAKTIMSFISFDSEVNTHEIIKKIYKP